MNKEEIFSGIKIHKKSQPAAVLEIVQYTESVFYNAIKVEEAVHQNGVGYAGVLDLADWEEVK